MLPLGLTLITFRHFPESLTLVVTSDMNALDLKNKCSSKTAKNLFFTLNSLSRL